MFCVSDILLLYNGDYSEPVEPAPVRTQTYPPTVPINELYANQNYPLGQEMPYPVSQTTFDHVTITCDVM